MPNCEICGKKLEMITHTHLKRHDLSVDEYKKRFPTVDLSSEKFRNKISEVTKGKKRPRSEIHQKHLTESIQRGFKNGRMTWIKGLTKETDKRVEMYAKRLKGRKFSKEHIKKLTTPERNQKISEAMKGRKITWIDKIITSERNAKISKALKGRDSYWMTGDKNVAKRPEVREKISNAMIGRIPHYPKLYYVPELGHEVRSSYEVEIGLILKKADISYDYEGKVYKFDGTSYRPDFPITDRLIVEAKGYFSRQQQEKYKKFKKAYPDVTLVIVGGPDDIDYAPICNIYIPWSDREKLVEGILREP